MFPFTQGGRDMARTCGHEGCWHGMAWKSLPRNLLTPYDTPNLENDTELRPRSGYHNLFTKFAVPRIWYQDSGTKNLVLRSCSWYQDPSNQILVPGPQYQDFGSKIWVPRALISNSARCDTKYCMTRHDRNLLTGSSWRLHPSIQNEPKLCLNDSGGVRP